MNKLLCPGTKVMAMSALALVSQAGFAQEPTTAQTPAAQTPAPAPAAAQRASLTDGFRLEAGAGLTHHSNATYQNQDEESDLERIIHANVGYQHADDGRFLADADYQLQRRDFARGVQSDQTAIDGRANVVVHLLERRLDAVLENQTSESLTDSRRVDSTNNQERRTVSTIGLDGYAHFSPVDSLVLSPRYTDVSMQKSSGSDSQRSMVTAAWQHQSSSVTQAQLSVTYGKVRFKDSDDNNYDIAGVQLGIRTALSRLSYQAAVGFNRFDRDHGDNVDGYMMQLGTTYTGDGYTWGGSLVHELTDTSIGLTPTEFVLANFNAQDSNFDAQDILKQTQLEVFGGRNFGVGQLELRAGYHRYDYDTLPRDEQGYYVSAGYQYPLNTYWALGANVRFEKTHFLNKPNDFTYHQTTPEIYASYRWTERLSVRLSWLRDDRSSNQPFNSYTDNQVLVDVNYRFF